MYTVILYSSLDINYSLKKCLIHHKIQPAQVDRTKEDDNHQRVCHRHHPQQRQRDRVPNEERDEKLVLCCNTEYKGQRKTSYNMVL